MLQFHSGKRPGAVGERDPIAVDGSGDREHRRVRPRFPCGREFLRQEFLQIRHAVVEQRFDLAQFSAAAEREPRLRSADIGDQNGRLRAQDFTFRRSLRPNFRVGL
jgi:hypothetical protein